MSKDVYLIYTDLHANIEGLRAAVDDAHDRYRVIKHIILGDMFTLGPNPVETFAYIKNLEIPWVFIHGNHEDYILQNDDFIDRRSIEIGQIPAFTQILKASYRWTKQQLGEQRLTEIASWLQVSHREVIGGRQFYFCHASDKKNDLAFNEEMLLLLFESQKVDAVVAGHTHRQVIAQLTLGMYYNVGSVGMPFDRDPRVAYAVIDMEGKLVVNRVLADTASTLKKLEASVDPFAPYAMANLKQSRVVRFVK